MEFCASIFTVLVCIVVVNTEPLRYEGILENVETLRKASCPCKDSKLCLPIQDNSRKEVFVFSKSNDRPTQWAKWDWSKLTTVCVVGDIDDRLMCLAHSHNAKIVILDAAKFDIENATLRTQWVAKQRSLINTHFLDGINIDYENSLGKKDQKKRDALTSLVKETVEALRKDNKYAQISIDVPYTPNFYDRYYNYSAIAEYVDFFFIMDYDESLGKYAQANSDLVKAEEGFSNYKALNIDASKLLLGFPWYGYRHICTQNKLIDNNCVNKHVVTFLYQDIFKLMQSVRPEVQWNQTSATPFFTYYVKSANTTYQMQYDDPTSLTIKNRIAMGSLGARGVGVWRIDFLDYSDTDAGDWMRKQMFASFPDVKVKDVKRT